MTSFALSVYSNIVIQLNILLFNIIVMSLPIHYLLKSIPMMNPFDNIYYDKTTSVRYRVLCY